MCSVFSFVWVILCSVHACDIILHMNQRTTNLVKSGLTKRHQQTTDMKTKPLNLVAVATEIIFWVKMQTSRETATRHIQRIGEI